jgi:hypothetical protein
MHVQILRDAQCAMHDALQQTCCIASAKNASNVFKRANVIEQHGEPWSILIQSANAYTHNAQVSV